METLKDVRKKARLTQVDAAKLCGVSRRKYQMYEEKDQSNDVYNQLLSMLKEMGINDKGPALLSVRYIKEVTYDIFARYKKVQCAYLFGSYARGEATVHSDVDVLVVAPGLEGLEFAGLHFELREALNKDVDLVSHTTLLKSEKMLRDILVQGVRIYGQRTSILKDRRDPQAY